MTSIVSPTGTRSGASRREIASVAVLFGGWILLLWLLTLRAGAIGIARSDDWSYLLTQFAFAESGSFVLNNWAVTMLIGQTFAAAPVVATFGNSIAALQAFVAVLSFLALVAAYVTIRTATPTRLALFSVGILAVSPIFGPSVVSFMTDVPALFFLSLSLLAGIRALKHSRPHGFYLVLSGVLGLVAFTFRDYAIISFVTVVVVGLFRVKDSRPRFWLVVALAAVGAVALLLYSWRHSLPNDLRLEGWPLDFSMQLVARGLLTVSLLAAPALAAIAWWRLKRPGQRLPLFQVVAVLLVAGAAAFVAGFELLGNVIHPYGSTWLVSGLGIRLWPLWVNRVILALAVLCLALAVYLAWWLVAGLARPRIATLGRWIGRDPAQAIIVLFPLVLLLAHFMATIILGTWFIDRYFILLLPFLAAALLIVGRQRSVLVARRWTLIPAAVLIIYAAWGLYVVDFDARFDGSRWKMGQDLAASGYAPQEIDAGMQWVSYHASDVGLGAQQVPTRPGRPWWTERYPEQRVCATVVGIDREQDIPEGAIGVRSVETLFGIKYFLAAVAGPDSCPDRGG